MLSSLTAVDRDRATAAPEVEESEEPAELPLAFLDLGYRERPCNRL